MDKKALGANIHKYRMEKGLTQEETAGKCSLSTNYFRQIELGNKVPRLETFLRIAEALEVSTELLLAGNVSWTAEIRSNELYQKLEDLEPSKQRFILETVDALIEGLKKM